MATYFTSHPGNIAIQQAVWTLTIDDAKKALTLLHCPKGSYWHQHFMRPMNIAKRHKQTSFKVYTAGFTTGEFSNILLASGVQVDCAD